MILEETGKVDLLYNSINTLLSGGTILVKTDTVYGLLADGNNGEAKDKIMSLKKRKNEIFAFFISGFEMAQKYCLFTERDIKIFNIIFPGHFTMLLQASEFAKNNLCLSSLSMAGASAKESAAINRKALISLKDEDLETRRKIGIRMPKSRFCLSLCSLFGKPILATSANISSLKSPELFEEVNQDIIENVDLCITEKDLQEFYFPDSYYRIKEDEQGSSRHSGRLGSTILDCTQAEIEVSREGSGDLRLIRDFLN